MRGRRKRVKCTIFAGVICFICTLYVLCTMAPPGSRSPVKPAKKQTIENSRSEGLPELENPGRNHVETNTMAKESAKTESDLICDTECQRLNSYIAAWSENKPKALIYYLTRLSRMKELKHSLEALEQYFNNVYSYPVVIFHESDLISSIPTIRTWTNSSLFFQRIAFNLPEFLNKPVMENIPCISPISYRHMCRFQAKLVYEQPIMQQIDFVWRLDDESLLTKPVTYDVFKYMRENKIQYGYIWIHRDAKVCVTNLWTATETYIKKYQIPLNLFPEWKSPRLYYNNFELSDMELWKSNEYRAFIDYIDKLGGIFYHRWGDAPIKGIAVSLFVHPDRLHHFKDIGYKHNTYINT